MFYRFLQSILDIISELQAEMDLEQRNFDGLSQQLSMVTDQASARFKQISQELVESQSRLALLMTRNMHAFDLVSCQVLRVRLM